MPIEVYCRFKTAKDAFSPVVLYARESNHEGADESLERQKERLKGFCEEKGYDIANEVATIGSREDSLPALKKAIEYAKTTPSRTILMASSNRVVGTASELESITELMNQSGVIIHTMDGSYEAVAKHGLSPEILIAQTLATADSEFDDESLDDLKNAIAQQEAKNSRPDLVVTPQDIDRWSKKRNLPVCDSSEDDISDTNEQDDDESFTMNM